MDWLRTRMRAWPRYGHGPDADTAMAWMRTIFGLDAVAAWTRPRTGHGLTVAADIGAAICPDRLRFLRVHCADAKTSF
jgi:hypothetical protein